MKTPYVRNVWQVILNVEDLDREFEDMKQKLDFMAYLMDIIAGDLGPQILTMNGNSDTGVIVVFFAELGYANALLHVWQRVMSFAKNLPKQP